MAQEPHAPTKETRRQVQIAAGLGLPHEMIGALIGICDMTVRKYYDTELKLGKAESSKAVAGTLFDKAMGGDTTAMIWWTKAQMRWAETQRHENTGANGEPIEHIFRWQGE